MKAFKKYWEIYGGNLYLNKKIYPIQKMFVPMNVKRMAMSVISEYQRPGSPYFANNMMAAKKSMK